jgi:hypothetical protein
VERGKYKGERVPIALVATGTAEAWGHAVGALVMASSGPPLRRLQLLCSSSTAFTVGLGQGNGTYCMNHDFFDSTFSEFNFSTLFLLDSSIDFASETSYVLLANEVSYLL